MDEFNVFIQNIELYVWVHTQPRKPGKMRVQMEISWNFEKFNKYHVEIIYETWKNLAATEISPLTLRYKEK